MEDYTYHFGPGEPKILGAHMLEVCPSIAAATPPCEIHPLSIGDREDPVRLVFDAAPGPGVVIGLVDMGDRFRFVANAIEVVPPDEPLPKLPVARAVWKPEPSLTTSAELWLTAGGPHHTVLTQAVGPEVLRQFADMLRTELLLIDAESHAGGLRRPGALEPGLLPAGRGPARQRVSTRPTAQTTGPSPRPADRWRSNEADTAGQCGRCRGSGQTLSPPVAPAKSGLGGFERRGTKGALIGVTMPTKSSERWIADGNNIKKQLEKWLQGRPAVRRERHPDPGQPDREPDHQRRQGADHRGDRRHRADHPARRGRRRARSR